MNGQILQAALNAQAQSQQPQALQVAAPMNDIQIVSFIAAHLDMETAEDKVEAACEIVAEAFLAIQGGDLKRLIEEKVAARQQRN